MPGDPPLFGPVTGYPLRAFGRRSRIDHPGRSVPNVRAEGRGRGNQDPSAAEMKPNLSRRRRALDFPRRRRAEVGFGMGRGNEMGFGVRMRAGPEGSSEQGHQGGQEKKHP